MEVEGYSAKPKAHSREGPSPIRNTSGREHVNTEGDMEKTATETINDGATSAVKEVATVILPVKHPRKCPSHTIHNLTNNGRHQVITSESRVNR